LIDLALLPGSGRWSAALDALLAHPGPLWICGADGTGVSSLARLLAERRGVAWLDDGERSCALLTWLAVQPRGVIGSHLDPEDPAVAEAAGRCLCLRLATLVEDPAAVLPCLTALAAEEGLTGPLPAALAVLPCPGNLRGLHNRVLRWKLLGQLPESAVAAPGATLPLDAEDMATNLHVLERLLLHRALRRSYGNRVEAAQRLGVSRRQLYLLIARHGDPVRGEAPSQPGPKRLIRRTGQNSRIPPGIR
jgi:hypothetical protein